MAGDNVFNLSTYLKELHEIYLTFENKNENTNIEDLNENNLNLDNIQDICHYVSQILQNLQNNAEDTKLLQEIFRIIQCITSEFCKEEKYDFTSELLKIKEIKFFEKNLLDKNILDLNYLIILCTTARLKILTGHYRDAFEILQGINEKLFQVKNTNLEVIISKKIDFDDDILYFWLSVLSYIAYTNHLLGRHVEAQENYKILLDNILHLIGIENDANNLSPEHYSKIFDSEKYKNILKFYSVYFNIFQIKQDIANENICIAREKRRLLPNSSYKSYYEKCFNEMLDEYKKALNIYQEVYIYKDKYPTFYNSVRSMANIHNELANIMLSDPSNEARLNKALFHCNEALQMYNELILLQRQRNLNTELVNIKNNDSISAVTRKIARAHKILGNLKSQINREEALQHYKKALAFYNEVYKHATLKVDEVHTFTINTISDLAFVNNQLGKLMLKEDKEISLQYYEEALKNLKQMYTFQKFKLGREDEKILNYQNNIAYILTRIGLITSNKNPKIALEHFQEAHRIYREILEILIRTVGVKHHITKLVETNIKNVEYYLNLSHSSRRTYFRTKSSE